VVKALCGKSVEASILTYMTTVQWREAFTKISDVLKITQMANRNHARLEELEVQTKKQAEQIALLLQTLALAAPKEKAEAVKKIILQAKKSEKA
jgi:hypothetical protein